MKNLLLIIALLFAAISLSGQGASDTIAYDSKGDLDSTIIKTQFAKDIGVTALTSPDEISSIFSKSISVICEINNNGLTEINEDFEVKYRMDSSAYVTQTVKASKNPIPASSTYEVSFSKY